MDLAVRLTRSTMLSIVVGFLTFLCSTLRPSTLMHLWFQALSRLRIPQFSSLDGVFPSRLIIWRTENFSAARNSSSKNACLKNDLAYQKIRHSNDPKKNPRGVHVIYGLWCTNPLLINRKRKPTTVPKDSRDVGLRLRMIRSGTNPQSPKKKLFILALDQWEGVEHFRGISE
jgi:hypothetical protein